MNESAFALEDDETHEKLSSDTGGLIETDHSDISFDAHGEQNAQICNTPNPSDGTSFVESTADVLKLCNAPKVSLYDYMRKGAYSKKPAKVADAHMSSTKQTRIMIVQRTTCPSDLFPSSCRVQLHTTSGSKRVSVDKLCIAAN